ncbi:MAG: hypothetical protein ACXWH0_15505 [Acidimicrobiia bacterium]
MGKHRPYRKRVKIGVSTCFLAGGLIVGSAFMPWFESEGGNEFSVGDVQLSSSASGWDLYGLRAPGEDGYAVDVSFTDPADLSSEPISVPTGLAALISGLCLASSTLFPLARFGSKGIIMQKARRRKLALRFLWVAYLVPAGLLGLAPSLGLTGVYLQARSIGGVSLGFGVVLLWAATLAGTVGVFMSGSGIGHAESLVPDVRGADWRHPYRLSGACPTRASGFMLAGIGGGVVVGFIGYWAGWLVYWVMSHLGGWVGVVGGASLEIKGESSSGNGARLALSVIAVMVIASVALVYPILLGVVSGSFVAFAASAGKCRNTSAATVFGLLGGVATWGTLALTGLLASGAVHESSRGLGLFDVVPGWLTSAVLAIDAALVILSAVYVVRKSMKKTPFCERCQQWYGMTTETTVPFGTAMPLVSALSSGSAVGLTPVQTENPAEIVLRLQGCECRLADSVLSADVTWQKAKRNGKVSAKVVAWFQTTLPPELGAAVEEALFLSPSDATAALTIENATAGKDPGANADRRMSDVGH